MARVTLNIAKSYKEGFIKQLENSQFFQLHKNATTRTDLYCFAIALCAKEGKEPTPIQNVGTTDTFVRTEFLANCEPLLLSVFYEDELKDEPDSIDQICNKDEVYGLVEKYANTGFGILENAIENFDEETLLFKLIADMDKEYEEIHEEVESLI